MHAVVLDAAELLGRFPSDVMTPELMQRAGRLGLIVLTEDAAKVRVADRRFLDAGSALAQLGIPLDVILDEWETLIAHTDQIAERFVELFEQYLAPGDWRSDLDSETARISLRPLPGCKQRLARCSQQPSTPASPGSDASASDRWSASSSLHQRRQQL
ncbi:MAG: hypothetical protein WKF58_04140 [Ilumatobacteraceae bacterium]